MAQHKDVKDLLQPVFGLVTCFFIYLFIYLKCNNYCNFLHDDNEDICQKMAKKSIILLVIYNLLHPNLDSPKLFGELKIAMINFWR